MAIHSGVVVGGDGFGYVFGEGRHIKFPQIGEVEIEDDVEIGCNSTVDRGSLDATQIASGVKIDNLVQIGHNVRIGENSILAAQVGISGSTKLGDFVMVGGQSGLAGHLNIGGGARIGAHAGVMRDVEPGQTVIGAPAVPAIAFWRQVAMIQRLAKQKDGG